MFIDTKFRWWYWIHPNTSWFSSFAARFLSPDIALWPEDTDGQPQCWAWASAHLSDVGTPQEMIDRSASLKALFDGAMLLTYGASYHPPMLTDLTETDDRRSTFLSGFNQEADVRAEPFSATYLNAKVDRNLDPSGDGIATLLFLARYDPVTRDLLKFVGVQGLTYVTLYAFTDWMNDGGWDDKRIALEAGWSNAMFKDFSGTANNPAYLGPFAGTAVQPDQSVGRCR